MKKSIIVVILYPGRVVLCMNEANKKADIIGTA